MSGEPAEPGAVAALAAVATEHADALVREAAVAALGAIGDEAGLAGHPRRRSTTRRRCADGRSSPWPPSRAPAVDAALARGRSDRDWQVRQAAEDLSD